MSSPLVIWLVGDGKPGHENQSLGLAEALGRRVAAAVHRIDLPKAGLVPRLRSAFRQARILARPDLILGAGHATHLALVGLARRTGAPCVVMMKPSLPCGLFDLCLVPAHDLRGGAPTGNIVPTIGALNRVHPAAGEREGGLFLIGGPSASHGWDTQAMLAAIGGVLAAPGEIPWKLTDSRRTPAGVREAIRTRFPHLPIFPHEETGPGWLPAHLASARQVWVGEDSVSMLYEALSSGAAVGLLPMPRIRADGRVVRGIDKLIAENLVTPYGTGSLSGPVRVLQEADRCAALILERWFSKAV